ncbi:hypothetical protein PFISCL1PPCAC_10420, partial [Pristionchus fissidentatus]
AGGGQFTRFWHLMSISQRFISSDGLIPSTIFDGGDADMDISEEMEEIRELLYETIKKKFPRGVAADHLAKIYKEEYVDSGLGPELPSNWLEQVKAAEEFEAQSRGPLTILFVRLHNSPAKKLIVQPPSGVVSPSPIVSIGKDETTPIHSPLELAAMLSLSKESINEGSRVIVVAFTHAADFYIRLESSQDELVKLKKHLASEYSSCGGLRSEEVVVNGAYALKDSQGDHFRVIVVSPPTLSSSVQCFFVDIGVRGSFPLSNLRLLKLASVEMCSSLSTRVSLSMDKKREGVDGALRNILFTHDTSGVATPTPFEVISIDKEGRDGCREMKMRDTKGTTIEQLLVDSLETGKENKRSQESGLPSHITLPAIGSLSDFDSSMEMCAMGISSMPRRPFLAHAIYASGPGEISLRQASLDPMPDYLYDRLNEECNDPTSVLKDAPRPGGFYAALVNGVWQRVQCVRSSKIDPNSFLLYLVDVGAFHYSKPSSIRRLNAFSPFKKMLIFKCKLFGVSPMGGAEVWSREAQLAVNEFLDKCESWPVEVVPRSEWSGWNQLNAPCLPLIEASIRSREGRDLADWLVYNRLAHPSI